MDQVPLPAFYDLKATDKSGILRVEAELAQGRAMVSLEETSPFLSRHVQKFIQVNNIWT